MSRVVVGRASGFRDVLVIAGSLVVALGAAFGIFRAQLPEPIGNGSMGGLETTTITIVAGLAAAAFAVWFLPPAGLFELEDDAVTAENERIPWSELVAFDDGSASEVALIRRDSRKVRLPTPDEAQRRELLAFLEMRLPRRS